MSSLIRFCPPLPVRGATSPVAASLLLALSACAETTNLDRVEAALEVEPARVVLDTVPVTVRTQASLTLRNVGAAQLTLTKVGFEEPDAAAVFRIDGDPPATMSPAQSFTLQIVATAEEVGEYEATLLIASNAARSPEVRIPVFFAAKARPPCDDGNECTEDVFDPVTNACSNVFADGRSCQPADLCIVDAVCQTGVCLGRQKTCDDGSVCTRDLCIQSTGECRFLDNEGACDDDNPCTADLCTEQGCVNEPVINGARCDDGDACTRQDSCFGGQCVGLGEPDGGPCDDGDSCTVGDVCRAGVCEGRSIITAAAEGDVIFSYPLTAWQERAFLHRRHVSMSDDGVFYGLDHLNLPNQAGLTHIVFAFEQCGSRLYDFAYRPPDPFVAVRHVRRTIQVGAGNQVRMVVGVRQLLENGFAPQTTTYLLDDTGFATLQLVRAPGGESGRSLLPDGSQIWGTVEAIDTGALLSEADAQQNFVIVRNDRFGNPLWSNARFSAYHWSEFLGVAGPRVLFWSDGRFGALDFNTGALVWSQPTAFITQEIALSTQLDLGVARAGAQILAVEILNGDQVFTYPERPDVEYRPRTDPVISADGRILFMMQTGQLLEDGTLVPEGLTWVELDTNGQVLSEVPLPYAFPDAPSITRAEDFNDDPYPTVADDGIAYVGYGDSFWAIEPGGRIRWTLTSTLPDAFTATVPLLREDGVLLMSRGNREIIGVRTNGGRMSEAGWASYRHDNDRTNFTP